MNKEQLNRELKAEPELIQMVQKTLDEMKSLTGDFSYYVHAHPFLSFREWSILYSDLFDFLQRDLYVHKIFTLRQISSFKNSFSFLESRLNNYYKPDTNKFLVFTTFRRIQFEALEKDLTLQLSGEEV